MLHSETAGFNASASPAFHRILSRLTVSERHASYVQARCPAHDDREASLTVTPAPAAVLLHCHANCETAAVLAAIGLEMRDLYDDAREPAKPLVQVQAVKLVATYDYCDADGRLAYQVCRFDPKKFSQRRPDGHGGWIKDLKGVEPLLYRLPQLIKAPRDEWVCVPEGEKDCDNLIYLGFVATTNSGGAGKFKPEFAPYFQDRKVALFPDHDDPGQAHARKVAALLAPYAREIRIVEPSAATPAKGDISDLIAKGWDRGMIQQSIDRAPVYQASTAIPILCETENQYPVVAEAAWKALKRANQPPRLFNYNGLPIRLDDERRRRALDTHSLRDELASAADWVDKKFFPDRPSVDFANLLLAGRSIPLPRVRRFATAPFFTADGRLVYEQGYDAEARTYLLATCELEVPERRAADDVKRAVELIDEMLCDFPLPDAADRAGAFAILVERPAREMIDGQLPGHLISAAKRGAGKGKLCKLVFTINGAFPAPWPGLNGGDENEIRKALTTFFMSGVETLFADNLNRTLKSATFASALTESHWRDRLLGLNRDVELEIRNSWYVTANNPILSSEMLRRFSRVRLVPATEHPEERTGFRHPDLLAWVSRNRAALLSSALILIQNWIAQGRPAPSVLPAFGSYEAWTETIGGILGCAGIKGFLENRRDIADQSDVETAPWRTFITRWFEQYHETPMLAKDLLPIAESVDDLSLGYKDDDAGSQRSKTKSLGRLLRSRIDSVFTIAPANGTDIEVQVGQDGNVKKTLLWRLRDLTKDEPARALV